MSECTLMIGLMVVYIRVVNDCETRVKVGVCIYAYIYEEGSQTPKLVDTILFIQKSTIKLQ